MEIWKDIIGYEGIYQVSNLGRVKSVERRVRNHKSGSTRLQKEQIITPTDNGNGYKIVCLRSKTNRKNKYVHRLVAEHFLDNPLGKGYVNHIDYDKSNNVVTNLEWCTVSENVAHSVEHMRKPKQNSKLPTTKEKYICRRIEHGKHIRYRVSIRKFGVDRSFKSLEEAIQFRNEVMQKWQNQ